ncbi:hypothetical protein XFF1815_390080 [Xanthomonas citri pv. fuscans]|nr:hypothetical protein XFF1815_390080 [Xanthomonas citri pv. fuscans]
MRNTSLGCRSGDRTEGSKAGADAGLGDNAYLEHASGEQRPLATADGRAHWTSSVWQRRFRPSV